MVVDTSALAAILFDGPDAEEFEAAIANDPVRLISAATLVEASTVVEGRLGEQAGTELDSLLEEAALRLSPLARSKPRSPAKPYAAMAKAAIGLP